MKNFLEKYFLQQKQSEINKLADEIYDKVIPIAKSLYLINELDDYSELDRLYNLQIDGDKNAKYILDLNDYLNEEDDEAIVFREVIKDIAPNPIYVRVFIVAYGTNQTGGFSPRDKAVSVYFSYKQYNKGINNFNIERLKKTLMHELTHAVDYMNDYYTKSARSVIPNLLPEKDLKLLNSISPYVYDVLYRLWNDSEINAQQITITNELITAIEKGIYSLKQTDCNNEVFSVLKQVIPSSREKISNERFKRWFIDNSNKRLKKLINKKTKNDYLLNNQQK